MQGLIKISKENYSCAFKEGNNVKNKVICHWADFLNSGFALKAFSDELYAYLIFHNSFPANENKINFYFTYFKECENAEKIFNTHTTMNLKKWLYIVENFYSAPDGIKFSENLFSTLNCYGSHSDVNSILKQMYKDFTLKISTYIDSFNDEINTPRLNYPKELK